MEASSQTQVPSNRTTIFADIKADLGVLFSTLYTERELCHDSVRFNEDRSEECTIDSASKFIICLHSPVVRAMLATSCQENRLQTVAIQQEFVGVWPHVVKFMYGQQVTMEDFQFCVSLLKVADYYDISQLKTCCSAALHQKSWSAEEAVTVLAELTFDTFLAARALALLETTPQTLFQSEHWERMCEASVQDFFGRKLACSEKDVFDAARRWNVAQSKGGAAPGLEIISSTEQSGQLAASPAGQVGQPDAGGWDDAGPEVGGKKRRRTWDPDALLPALLLKEILFEHMSPEDLLACRPYLPMEEYIDFMEVVAKAKPAVRVPRSNRVSTSSQVSSQRCSRCGHTLSSDPGDAPACRRHHPRPAVKRSRRVNYFSCRHKGRCPTCPKCQSGGEWIHEEYFEYSCCGQPSHTLGCAAHAHDWDTVWIPDILK